MNYHVSMALADLRKAAASVEKLDGQADRAERLIAIAEDIERYFAVDIDLSVPDYDEGPAEQRALPLIRVATVDEQVIQFVNWVDFRGWEVRLVDPYSNMNEPPKRLGFINQSGGEAGGQWRAKRLPELAYPTRKSFPRVDEAVRYLMSLNGPITYS